ncbi:outer membrane protein assembly factor BamB family protein [Streptomyces sp. NPDC055055]
MRRRRWRALSVALVGLLVTGCFAPQGPMFDDGSSVPEEAARVPLPVRPGPDGTWALNSPEDGLLGQDRTIARRAGPERPEWTATLPTEFALTSQRPGTAHSAYVDGSVGVLVGGSAGREGPSAVAGLDLATGRLTWRRTLAPGSRVFLHDSGFGTVVEAQCGGGSCRMSGWGLLSGERRWARTEQGAVRMLDSCQADAFLPAQRRSVDRCYPYLVTAERIAALDPDDGRVSWMKDVRLPRGRIDRIRAYQGRITLATAPARGSCLVTVAALPSPGSTDDTDRGWQRTLVWDQPQAPRDPDTGCRWDRTIPLVVGSHMTLPDAKGALVSTPGVGAPGPSRRLAPGEYLVADTSRREVVRRPGRPDRPLFATEDRVRPPGLTPAARELTRHVWQDGRRLLLLDHEDRVLWEDTSDCQAFRHSENGDFLTYCDGTDLVTLRPVSRD